MKCLECNKSFQDLRSHLRKHKMTWMDYRDKHGVNPNGSYSIVGMKKSEKDRISTDSHMFTLGKSVGYLYAH